MNFSVNESARGGEEASVDVHEGETRADHSLQRSTRSVTEHKTCMILPRIVIAYCSSCATEHKTCTVSPFSFQDFRQYQSNRRPSELSASWLNAVVRDHLVIRYHCCFGSHLIETQGAGRDFWQVSSYL